VGDILGADDTFEAGTSHLGTAEASEGRVGQARPQIGDDACAVVVARGLASGEEDTRIGVARDANKFISPCDFARRTSSFFQKRGVSARGVKSLSLSGIFVRFRGTQRK
jgi:hypothetical protein